MAHPLGKRWKPRRDDVVPAHAQIEARFAEQIEAGHLEPGDRLPAERDLAESLDVSRMTVRQALSSLSSRGLVERGVGRGTFVAPDKLEHDLSRLSGFTEQMQRQGIEPGAELLGATAYATPEKVAGALDIEPGAPALRIQRLRLGNGVALALEDSWFPLERFPGLGERDLGGSLYAVLRDGYDAEPVRAIERLEPIVADAGDAAALRISHGAPLMLVERTACTAAGTPVEFARDRFRGDRARFVINVAGHAMADA